MKSIVVAAIKGEENMELEFKGTKAAKEISRQLKLQGWACVVKIITLVE